jgi:undecaprenyl-diphosphatase
MVLLVAGARAFGRYGERISQIVGDARRRTLTSRQYLALRDRFPGVRSFVAARFARGEYLGLHLTVGFLISVGALLLFGAVTEDVVNHEPLTTVDLQLLSWIRSHATPTGDRIAMGISTVGGPTAMAIIAIVVAIVLASRRWWITLAAWIAALAGGGALDWLLKVIIRRPRPVGAEQFLSGHSFSFPSGHSMGSLVGLGMLAYVLIAFWLPARRHRTLVVAVAFGGVLLIGASRMYLGVHYLSDVIAGFAAGGLWLAACVTGVEIALRQRGLTSWETPRIVSGEREA